METKFKIIEPENYTLAVSDEEIKWGESNLTNGRDVFDFAEVKEYSLEYANRYWEKIIAYQPKGNAPELDLPLLPELILEEDLIKFAEYCRDIARREGTYGSGFTNNWELCENQKIVTTKELLNNFQSLKQPKTPKWFVAETESIVIGHTGTQNVFGNKLKTTTINGKTYLVGTFLYE
jgi:hypothetical protein